MGVLEVYRIVTSDAHVIYDVFKVPTDQYICIIQCGNCNM